jgi:hypothetical protein
MTATNSDANEVLAAIKAKCATDATFEIELTAAWNRVCNEAEKRAIKRKLKVFEVRHELQIARLSLFRAVNAGVSFEGAEHAALCAVGIV